MKKIACFSNLPLLSCHPWIKHERIQAYNSANPSRRTQRSGRPHNDDRFDGCPWYRDIWKRVRRGWARQEIRLVRSNWTERWTQKNKKKGTPARKKERKRNAKRSSVSSVCFRWCGRFPSAPTANQAHCRIIIVCVLARFVRMAADRLQPSRCLHLHHPESTLAASAIKGDREIGGRGASIATSFAALGSYVASQWTPHYGSTREDSDYLYRRGKIVTESERGLSDEMLSGVGRDFDNFDHTTNGDPQSAPDLIATFASRRLFYFRFPHCVMSDFSRTAQLSPAGSLFRTLTERSCCLLFFLSLAFCCLLSVEYFKAMQP